MKTTNIKAKIATTLLVGMNFIASAQPGSYVPVTNAMTTKAKTFTDTALTIMDGVGWAVAVGGLIWLGVSYITQSQNIKKQVITTIIGVFILGARQAILLFVTTI